MRILAWNLLHGGGKRIDRICKALSHYDADLIILSEFRQNKVAVELQAQLKADGYSYQSAPHALPKENTVCIAARKPFEAVTFPGQPADEEFGDFTNRVLMARFEGLNIFGLLFPGQELKRPVFDFLLNLPNNYFNEDTVLMGDFNTGRHYEDEKGATNVSAHQFDALLDQGWIDSWRIRNPEAKEFTWFSRGYNNSFRLDHALVSPSMNERITEVKYSHSERENGDSDHSLMVLDLE